jgi:glutathione peroxidase
VASIHNISIGGINGKEIKFDQFKGKKLLIVNVASACGFTPQYEQLDELYRQYQDRLVVIGCPCNDFGRQEQGDEKEIQSFCKTMFDVTFPLTKKINIRSSPVHPLYEWLTMKERNGVSDNEVSWNFQKYAISPQGEWQHMFSAETSPLDDRIIKWIEAA